MSKNTKTIKNAIANIAPATPVVAKEEVVNVAQYDTVMADVTIHKQFCLKEKVSIPRIERVLTTLREIIGTSSKEDAVATFMSVGKEAGSLVEAMAIKLNLSPSTIAEELSEVVCSRNRNAVTQFVSSQFHQFLDIGEICYYTSARNKFIKAANANAAKAAATPTI